MRICVIPFEYQIETFLFILNELEANQLFQREVK